VNIHADCCVWKIRAEGIDETTDLIDRLARTYGDLQRAAWNRLTIALSAVLVALGAAWCFGLGNDFGPCCESSV